MVEKDKELLGARIQDLIHDYQVDPQKLLKLAQERAIRAAAQNLTPSQDSLPAVPHELQTLGSYELMTLLGRGGTGKVYKARHRESDDIVALKILSPHYLSDEHRLLRFYMEAEAASCLKHPSIVHIHKVDDERGYHYMVMDYVDGIELSELVEDEPLSADTAARIVMVIAEVMDYVHRQGILHRDLKPSNVMIDTKGKLWVTDFGIAKLQSGSSTVTTTGMLLGTPSYMPPEQVGGKSDSLGPTCDIYSLGAMLYEMLTMEPPFQGDSPYETLQMVLHNTPKLPREINQNIPKVLESICLKCLEKDPKNRYASSADLAADLKSFLSGNAVQASGGGLLRQALGPATASPASLCEPDVMERWGRILRWYALLWLSLCLASQLLLWGSVNSKTSLTLLWSCGGVALLSVFLSYRFYRLKALTSVERQALGILCVFLLGFGAFVMMQISLPGMHGSIHSRMQFISFGLFLSAIAFGCLCVVVDGSFLFLALALLGMPLVHLYWPHLFFLILGLLLAVGFYLPGQRFARAG